VAAAELEREKVASCIQQLDGSRAEIIKRRQARDLCPDDGAKPELHTANRGGLSLLLPDCDAVVAVCTHRRRAHKGAGRCGAPHLRPARGEALRGYPVRSRFSRSSRRRGRSPRRCPRC
jgi:hypothetical protein